MAKYGEELAKETFEGEIVGFKGSWLSNICLLKIKDKKGDIHSVACDNAPTVRALDRAFGDVIGRGHTINVDKIKGKKIKYKLTPWATLSGFEPIED